MSNLILYTTEDGRSQIKLRAQEQTVWLTQLEMAELFDASKQNVSLHLKNIFEDGELDPAATVKESLTVQIEGSRQVQRPVTLYNLNAILLTHAGKVSHEQMEAHTSELYAAFDQDRKAAEARAADAQDEAELTALAATLKKRVKP
jgi:hypothetical protein